MSEIRYAAVGDQEDPDLNEVLLELERVTGVPLKRFARLPLVQYLGACVYPGADPNRRVPISTDHLLDVPLLCTPVGKLPQGDLYTLCAELGAAKGVEFYHRRSLAAFLNAVLPKLPKPKKLTPTQQRKANILTARRFSKRRP